MIEVEAEHLLTELALVLVLVLRSFSHFFGSQKIKRQKQEQKYIHTLRSVYVYQIDARIKYSFEKSMRIGMEGSNKKLWTKTQT